MTHESKRSEKTNLELCLHGKILRDTATNTIEMEGVKTI